MNRAITLSASVTLSSRLKTSSSKFQIADSSKVMMVASLKTSDPDNNFLTLAAWHFVAAFARTWEPPYSSRAVEKVWHDAPSL